MLKKLVFTFVLEAPITQPGLVRGNYRRRTSCRKKPERCVQSKFAGRGAHPDRRSCGGVARFDTRGVCCADHDIAWNSAVVGPVHQRLTHIEKSVPGGLDVKRALPAAKLADPGGILGFTRRVDQKIVCRTDTETLIKGSTTPDTDSLKRLHLSAKAIGAPDMNSNSIGISHLLRQLVVKRIPYFDSITVGLSRHLETYERDTLES